MKRYTGCSSRGNGAVCGHVGQCGDEFDDYTNRRMGGRNWHTSK